MNNVKRKWIKTFTAMVLVFVMLGSSVSVYAEPNDLSQDITESRSESVPESGDVIISDDTADEGEAVESGESSGETTEKSTAAEENAEQTEDETENTETAILEEEALITGMASGYYTLSSVMNGSMVMDIVAGSENEGQSVDIYKSNSTYAQSFYFTNLGDGVYTIRACCSDKMLTAGTNPQKGTYVTQAKANGSDSQKWKIYSSSRSGYYNIVSYKNPKLAMDIYGGKTANGTKVWLYDINDNKAQQWAFNVTTNNELRTLLNMSKVDFEQQDCVVYNKAGINLALSVAGGSTANQANIEVSNCTGAQTQIFRITRVSDGIFKLINTGTGKAVDIYGGYTAQGTNVHQYTWNESKAQLFYIKKASDGSIVFQSIMGDKVLTADGTAAGSNVCMKRFSNSNSQKWSFGNASDIKSLATGIYTIQASANSGYCLDVYGGKEEDGTNIQLYTGNGTQSQQFYFSKGSDGYYTITNVRTRKVLDVYGAKAASGTNVWQYSGNGSKAQKWSVVANNDGTYSIISALGNFALDVYGASYKNGTNIWIYTANNSAAQKFKLNKVSVSAPSSGKLYTIRSKVDSSKVLDVYGGRVLNLTNVQIYSSNNSNAQKWWLTDKGGYYEIRSAASGKALDVAAGSSENGANVDIYTPNGTNAQKWKLVSTGDADGSYYIVNGSGKYLDIYGGKTASGTNVQQYTSNKSNAQKFYISETSKASNKWYTDYNNNRYYYSNGALLKNTWAGIQGSYYYFGSDGKMVRSTTVDGYQINAEGQRGAKVYTTITSGISHNKTVKALLQNALQPIGKCLYIWGGGHGDSDTGVIGVQAGWQKFYAEHDSPNYDYTQFRWQYGNGLDCSGFVGWTMYNTLYSQPGQAWLAYTSTETYSKLVGKGWATDLGKSPSKFYPGDIVSMNGHVWITLGQCSDGSIVLVHCTTNGGVQISGTVTPSGSYNSQAITLATKYMAKYFPNWNYNVKKQSTSYFKNVAGVAHWKTSGGVLTDPDGMQKMSADQVLKTLLGSV